MVPGTLPVTIPHFLLAVFIPSLLKESECFLHGVDRGTKGCGRELRGIFLFDTILTVIFLHESNFRAEAYRAC